MALATCSSERRTRFSGARASRWSPFMVELPTGAYRDVDVFGYIDRPDVQSGSGSTDFIGSLQYQRGIGTSGFGLLAAGMYRTNGESPLGYQFGEDASFGFGLTRSSSSRFRWSAQFASRWSARTCSTAGTCPPPGYDPKPGPGSGVASRRPRYSSATSRSRSPRAPAGRRSPRRGRGDRRRNALLGDAPSPAVAGRPGPAVGRAVDRPNLAERRGDPAVARARHDRDGPSSS